LLPSIAPSGAFVETRCLPASVQAGLSRRLLTAAHDEGRTTERKNAMVAFLKSDLFLRFFGGFVIGAIGMFALQPNSESPALTSPAMAASASATPAANNAAL
jgi:hypothetical protein